MKLRLTTGVRKIRSSSKTVGGRVVPDLNLSLRRWCCLSQFNLANGHRPTMGGEDFFRCFVTESQEKFMALRLEDKKKFVKEVNAVAGDSITAVAAEYRGLSVAEMTDLRKDRRAMGSPRISKGALAGPKT